MLVCCLLTQVDYLNKALDLFNTAIVSPIYYVMFTLLSITASVIMYQVGGRWRRVTLAPLLQTVGARPVWPAAHHFTA